MYMYVCHQIYTSVDNAAQPTSSGIVRGFGSHVCIQATHAVSYNWSIQTAEVTTKHISKVQSTLL